MIPISTVRLPAECEQLVSEVLRSGVLAQGPMVLRLEEEFARLCETEHAIAVSLRSTPFLRQVHRWYLPMLILAMGSCRQRI